MFDKLYNWFKCELHYFSTYNNTIDCFIIDFWLWLEFFNLDNSNWRLRQNDIMWSPWYGGYAFVRHVCIIWMVNIEDVTCTINLHECMQRWTQRADILEGQVQAGSWLAVLSKCATFMSANTDKLYTCCIITLKYLLNDTGCCLLSPLSNSEIFLGLPVFLSSHPEARPPAWIITFPWGKQTQANFQTAFPLFKVLNNILKLSDEAV